MNSFALALTAFITFFGSLNNPTVASVGNTPSTLHRSSTTPQPIVGSAVAGDLSIPLRQMTVVAGTPDTRSVSIRRFTHIADTSQQLAEQSGFPDLALQTAATANAMPAPTVSFEGINDQTLVVPPDPNGAVGRLYYVQAVNFHLAVYQKSNGLAVLGPVPTNNLWAGFGGACESQNNGDPIVLYDQLADRWLVSQFAIPSDTGPFFECVAVSQTEDPTGAWYRYAFQMPAVPGYANGKFNDYPKLAVWPDAYYMSVNEFSDASPSAFFTGVGVFALNRLQMLSGAAMPSFVYFDVGAVNANFSSMLPANLDGTHLPPAGAPGYFAEVDEASASAGWPVDAMRLWQFRVNWTNPVSSTFGLSSLPNNTLMVTPYSVVPCSGVYGLSCIPQPGAPSVDAVGDRLMHRLVYRNFGDHEALVVNHTVYANNVAGIRWYEVRDPSGAPTIYQHGTYAPDSIYRWMGSMAFDHTGNIAVGYSASSSSVYPSIRYAGRLVNDAAGQLSQGENTIFAGTGSQLNSGIQARWGDYSSMSVDPTDDCTFWYTNQYYPATAYYAWHTRIASFKFPNCGSGSLAGRVSDINTGLPVSGAVVSALSTSGDGSSTSSSENGLYGMILFSGTYSVTASAYGYLPATLNNISVTVGLTTTSDISLSASAAYTVTGRVTDIVRGDPISASIFISGTPFNPPIRTISTDANGAYTVTLAANQAYTLTASSGTRPPQTVSIDALTSDRVVNFELWTQVHLIVVLRQ